MALFMIRGLYTDAQCGINLDIRDAHKLYEFIPFARTDQVKDLCLLLITHDLGLLA